MADKKWTPEQENAIISRGGTVLVSAAAGSGKTAVLVERVVGRILDLDDPVDADRLLIATFSNAAALEMKQRITARISQLIAESPENERLQRQQLLLGRAQIGTIHSFCIDLIRSNFQVLGVPSNIRVGDEKELEILRRDCAHTVVEQFHAQDESGAFGQLVELLSSGRDDSRVFDTLFSLYDFVRSHPFYNDWLDQKQRLYDEGVRAVDSLWGQCILNYAADAAEYARKLIFQAFLLMEEDEAMSAAYRGAFQSDLALFDQLSGLIKQRSWDGICNLLGSFSPEKLRPLKGDSSGKAAAQALRANIKDIFARLRDKQFCANEEEFSNDIAFLRPLVGLLFDLTRAFDRVFTEEKQRRGMMDFSDMEHYAISLLVRPAGPGYLPLPLAESVAARFDEVLIDECQDINAAQEIIFRSVSRKENNLFLVGDVKQSIYRFRQAMPELFLAKKKAYAPYDGLQYPAKIILGRNFRSAPNVTDNVNFFFAQLMSEALGEIDYNEEESLVAAASFPDGIGAGCSVELLDLTEYAGERDKTALEAEHVAKRISGLLSDRFPVADGGVLRPIRPKDICILLRATSSKARTYLDALTARGVPVWAEPKSGFLTTKEIAPVISFLRVLNNPLLDIDLAAVMASALFGFSADELARIRLAKRSGALWLAVEARAEEGDTRCNQFIKTVGTLRRFAANASADAVIREIYDRTGYSNWIQVMKRGADRRANLLLLVQYACDYDANGYKGLSGFIGFLDRLLERGGDLAPASGLSEQADVVRVMSIHRSKGLEFPVVFVCDCGKRFNREDLNGNTLLHSELGFACMRRDFDLMKQYTTVPMQALRLELERAMLSEELRVLYVALTRAKQQLILTGTTTKTPERMASLICTPEDNGKLPAYLVRGAASYLDWILMAAMHHPALSAQISELGLDAGPIPAKAELSLQIISVLDDETLEQAQTAAESAMPDEAFALELERRFAYSYPYEAQTRIPTKLAVSQIAKGDMSKAYRFARRPAFLSATGMTGTQKGNALHHFMQFADYQAAARDAAAEIARMERMGFLSKEEAGSVDRRRLNAFFQSSLAARIFAAEKVYRELRFLSEVGEAQLGEYTDLFEGASDDSKTAVQGVADCVFIENGEAVIVDYKSDYVKEAEELAERYRIQLALYRKVLAESLGVPVKECIIYSFSLSQEISI